MQNVTNKLSSFLKMPLHTILKVLVLALLFTSCIPTKKIVYLDSEEFKAPYSLDSWEYKIRTGDRFYIKITDPNAGITFGQSMDVNVQTDDAVNLIQQIPSVHDYIVLEDGSIDLPLLGKISAKDKTVMELTTLIRESCAGYITSPSVKLFMTNYNVTLLGEFNKPGQYQLITNKPTIFDAIGMGNDFTDYARREKVKLIRTNTDGVSITYLDLTDPNFVSSPYYYVQPNDVIHVMPLKVKKYSSDNALPLIISAMSTLILLYSIIITR